MGRDTIFFILKIVNFIARGAKRLFWEVIFFPIAKIISLKKFLGMEKDRIYFKYFYKGEKRKVRIILVDFAGYPIYRVKPLSPTNIIVCGIGNILDNMAKFDAGVEFDVTMIINSATESQRNIYRSLQERFPFIKSVYFRDNSGLDFGAYRYGYKKIKDAGYPGDIVFMNSSASGPRNDFWLLKYSYLFHRAEKIGLCGASINSDHDGRFMPHIQSFFLYTNMDVLANIFNDSIPEVDLTQDKGDIVKMGELEFSRMILDNGYGITSKLFDNFVYYKGRPWTIPLGDMRYDERYKQFANKI